MIDILIRLIIANEVPWQRPIYPSCSSTRTARQQRLVTDYVLALLGRGKGSQLTYAALGQERAKERTTTASRTRSLAGCA